MSELIGQTIEQYQIEAVLGHGSMGTVYQAYDIRNRRFVAVKVMHAHLTEQMGLLNQFTTEIETLRRLDHPAIIPLYDSGLHDGQPYFVTELLDGIDLRGRIRQLRAHGQLMKLPDVVALASQIAQALEHMRQQLVVHRDIKPENIFLKSTATDKIELALIDFGLAQRLDEAQQNPKRAFQGSAPYMAPEIIFGNRLDTRSDLYALGVTLYELLTGRQPYGGETMAEVLRQHMQETPTPLRAIQAFIPADLEAIVLRLLAKHPDHRYQSGAEVAADLAAISTAIRPRKGAVPPPTYQAASTSDVTTQLEMPEYVARVRIPDRIDLNETWYGGQFRLLVGHEFESTVTYSLDKAVLTIGRAPDNDIVLSDYRVSRHHGRLEQVTRETADGSYIKRWQLLDTNSINGVYNSQGERLEAGEVHLWEPNRTWRIGPYFLQWEQLDGQQEDDLYQFAAVGGGSPSGQRRAGGRTGAAVAGAATAQAIPRVAISPLPAGTSQPTFATSNEAGFTARLEPATVRLARGEQQQVSLIVRNTSHTADDLMVILEGYPQGITYQGENTRLLPGEEKTLLLTLWLADERTAGGAHEVAVMLRSQLRGRIVATLPLTIEVAAVRDFHHELQPSNLDGRWWRPQVSTVLQVFNNGNERQAYQIRAADPNDNIRFEWDNEWVTVAANQHRGVPIALKPKNRPLFGAGESYQFHVRVAPAGNLAEEEEVQGQYKVPSYVPGWVLVALPLLFIVCAALSFLGYGRYQEVQAEAAVAMAAAEAASENLDAARQMATSEAQLFTTRLAEATLQGEGAVATLIAESTLGADSLMETVAAAEAEATQPPLPTETPEPELTSTPTPTLTPTPTATPSTFILSASEIVVSESDGVAIVEMGLASTPLQTISIEFATIANSAKEGDDFEAVAGTLVWEEGDSSNKTVRITLLDNDVTEETEIFDLEFSNASGALGGDQVVTITISDDDGEPQFSAAASTSSIQEGNNSGNSITVQVVLSGKSTEPLTASCRTAPGTATAGEDYQTVAQTLTWTPGESGPKNCVINIIGDRVDEPDEAFSLFVVDESAGSSAQIDQISLTIVDDDDLPTVAFETAVVGSVNEDTDSVTVNLTMAGTSAAVVRVNVIVFGGTAQNGADYSLPENSTVTWDAGENGRKTFEFTIQDDPIFEPNETIKLQLTSPVNAQLVNPNTADITIISDDQRGVNIQMPGNATIIEGNANNINSYTLNLTSVPDSAGVIVASVDSDDCLIRSEDDETFGEATTVVLDSLEAKTVFVQAVDDNIIENPKNPTPPSAAGFNDALNRCEITHEGNGANGYFEGLNIDSNPPQTIFQVVDNDVVAIKTTLGNADLFEDTGGPNSHTYQLALLKQPAEGTSVAINISIPAVPVASLAKTCLFNGNGTSQTANFTNANWNVNQPVTIVSVADNVDEGTRGNSHPSCQVQHQYNNTNLASGLLQIPMQENDTADINVQTEVGSTGDNDADFFIEETDTGEDEDFIFELLSQPLGQVTVIVTAISQTIDMQPQCLVSKNEQNYNASVTYVINPLAWNPGDEYHISVKAENDDIDESKNDPPYNVPSGSHDCALLVSFSSNDPNYSNQTPTATYLNKLQTELDKVAIIDDDDPPVITVTQIGGVNVGSGSEIIVPEALGTVPARFTMSGRTIHNIEITRQVVATNPATCTQPSQAANVNSGPNSDVNSAGSGSFIWSLADHDQTNWPSPNVMAVIDDPISEQNECFVVNFIIANNSSAGDGPATFADANDPNNPNNEQLRSIRVVITDNDPPPTITVAEINGNTNPAGGITINEGNSGSQTITARLSMNGGRSASTTVTYTLTGTACPDNATIGGDVTNSNSSFIWAADTVNASVTQNVFSILGDITDENNECFTITFTTASGVTITNPGPFTITIVDDDP